MLHKECGEITQHFGTDQFTGNVLFAVFFVLSIGLYCGFQSVIEDVFNRLQSLFRRREVMAIAETPTDEQIAIPTVEEPDSSIMECSAPAQEFVTDNCPEMTLPNDSNEEIEEDVEYLTLEDGGKAISKIIRFIIIYPLFFDYVQNIVGFFPSFPSPSYPSLHKRNEFAGKDIIIINSPPPFNLIIVNISVVRSFCFRGALL